MLTPDHRAIAAELVAGAASVSWIANTCSMTKEATDQLLEDLLEYGYAMSNRREQWALTHRGVAWHNTLNDVFEAIDDGCERVIDIEPVLFRKGNLSRAEILARILMLETQEMVVAGEVPGSWFVHPQHGSDNGHQNTAQTRLGSSGHWDESEEQDWADHWSRGFS